MKTEATDPNGPTGTLACWLAELSWNDIPSPVVERAKEVILDGLGCALVGARLPWSDVAVKAVQSFEGPGDAAIIGWNASLAPPAAALLNGTFIQGFELDDFHPLAPLHSASIILPALLAYSAIEPMTGKDFLHGAIAGFEVGPRVGQALHGAQMLSRGWHSGSVFGTHAAAAAVGKVAKFSSGQFEDALGLAGTQSCGLMAAQYEAMSKRMHHGIASRNGFYAAMLASAGYTGIKRVFEREYGGFLSVFGEGHDPRPEKVCEKLGEIWETQRIVLKPYAAMGALHGPLDAILALMARRPVVPEEIERIDIGMSHAAYHHGWWELEPPLTPTGAQMNVAYAVAVAILDGDAMVRQFAPDRINREDVWALIPKIRAYHEESFDRERGRRGSARLIATFKDGTQEESMIEVPRTYGSPLNRDEVMAKFATLTQDVISETRGQEIVDTVFNLENTGSVQALVDLLAAEAGVAF